MTATLVIDNIDSFVYNIVQYVGQLGGDPIVLPNTASLTLTHLGLLTLLSAKSTK